MMTNIKNTEMKCEKCNEILHNRNVDYFAKRGIILLAILGGLTTAGFYYIAFATTRGGNLGKFLVVGTIGIFTLIYKISTLQKNILACPLCEPSTSTET